MKSGEEEVEIHEDSRRRLKDGTIEVKGTWVARAKGGKSYRRPHKRRCR